MDVNGMQNVCSRRVLGTFPLHTERTQSMICPVSRRKALQRFSSWSHSFRAPPSLDLHRQTCTSLFRVHNNQA